VARGSGAYAFSHLTFQEYLAAVEIADNRPDLTEYLLARLASPWWREVVLLATGHLATRSAQRTAALIEAIAGCRQETERYQNLSLLPSVYAMPGPWACRLHWRSRSGTAWRASWAAYTGLLALAAAGDDRVRHGTTPRGLSERRRAAAEALARIGGRSFWTLPYGEPDWVPIPRASSRWVTKSS